jgi:hypothetical protein
MSYHEDQERLDNLAYSDEYAEFIMANPRGRVICNGDSLLNAMEEGYLFEEFVASIGESYLLDPEVGDGMTDAEADADVLRSAGWGTDEDYGDFGGDRY